MKDLTVIKLPKRLFGKTNCKLQQDKEKVLKPLGSQDFLVAGGGFEPPASGL